MDIIQTITLTIASSLIGGFTSFYFAQKTENYRFLQLQKQKAEAVARLFAKWTKYKGKENELLNQNELLDYFEELNQMSFELSLWIQDEELLTDIMLRLQNDSAAKDVRTLVGETRKLILEKPNDKFDHQQITLWPKN